MSTLFIIQPVSGDNHRNDLVFELLLSFLGNSLYKVKRKEAALFEQPLFYEQYVERPPFGGLPLYICLWYCADL